MIENSSITTTIYSWMLNNLKLSGVELLAFSILCSIGETTASQLSEFVGMNERTTVYTLDKLLEKECVVKTGGITNGKRTPVYYAVKREYEIWYENSYLREKEAKREVSIKDYPISKSLIKETKDIHSTKVDDSTKDIVDNSHNKDTTIPKEKVNKFIPPTVEQVRVYCEERKNGIDAENFVNFYESKGWMIGKNKMKNWKAAVRTWENKRKEAEKEKEPKKYAQLDDIF